MPSYVVTGASRGLGYAWIKHLSSNPANIVIGIVRNRPATEAQLAKDNIKNVSLLAADVTDIQALQNAADETAKLTGGSLDYLIHNAALVSGRSQFSSILDDTPQGLEDDLLESFKANVVGAAHTINTFLPLVRKGQAKKVVVINTGLADDDLTNTFEIEFAAPYSLTKAAARTLMSKYHAAAGKKEGILFLSLSPGMVDTREGELTDEQMKNMQSMVAKFLRYAPHFKGPITAQQSVEYQLEVIERATVEEFGGAFVSHFGNKQWL